MTPNTHNQSNNSSHNQHNRSHAPSSHSSNRSEQQSHQPPHHQRVPFEEADAKRAAALHPAAPVKHSAPAHGVPASTSAAVPSFSEMHVIEPILKALSEEGYTTPTPIQAQSIPPLLAGRDLLGCAQTGTGKTAAFTIPILQKLFTDKKVMPRMTPRVLILAPTRELAAQIGVSIKAYGRHTRLAHTVIFGGVGQNPQVDALRRGVDIVVATPGRLLDLLNQRHVELDGVEIFVLDEADRMLDMGFIHDIRKIITALPRKRQNLFFSATLEHEVISLAKTMVHDPVHVTITPNTPTVDRITQKLYFIDREHKDDLLFELLKDPAVNRVMIFAQMKHSANKLSQKLSRAGVRAEAIHGNKSQSARTAALNNFRSGRTRVLVATDIAARGLDIDGVTHVINYELPNEPESYVHRIGRTARAGAEGDAVSFCSANERDFLRAIEKFIKKEIPVVLDHPFHSERAMRAFGSDARPPPKHPFARRTHSGAGSHRSQRGPSSGHRDSRGGSSSGGRAGGSSSRPHSHAGGRSGGHARGPSAHRTPRR